MTAVFPSWQAAAKKARPGTAAGLTLSARFAIQGAKALPHRIRLSPSFPEKSVPQKAPSLPRERPPMATGSCCGQGYIKIKNLTRIYKQPPAFSFPCIGEGFLRGVFPCWAALPGHGAGCGKTACPGHARGSQRPPSPLLGVSAPAPCAARESADSRL